MDTSIVVVGASSGGVEAIISFISALSDDFFGSILIVLHGSVRLPIILRQWTSLCSVYAEEGDVIRPGWIYVAPVDRHLSVENERIHLFDGPKENKARPAVDVLFRSAAQQYKERAIGVILSGALEDGSRGISEIKKHGGVAIAQDPAEAMTNTMPLAAIARGNIDYVLPVKEAAQKVSLLVRENQKRAIPSSGTISHASAREKGSDG